MFCFRKQTAVYSPSQNATEVSSNHRSIFQPLDNKSLAVNSSLQVAEPRQFPVGTPDSFSANTNLISPFDVSTFGKQLLPLINVNIKEKVKDFAKSLNSGADYIEEAIRDNWRESPLNPHNFEKFLSPPNMFAHLPPSINDIRKPQILTPPAIHKQPKALQKHKSQKTIENYSTDAMMHDYGINRYKHFENSILRELERQEELKVEATIHTLFEQGDRVEIIKGKPYNYKSGWSPVAPPTKNYDDANAISSQIISPLHTSIFSESHLSSVAPSHNISPSFHNFDTIHSTYSLHEEEGESKLKPVQVSAIKNHTPSSSNEHHFKPATRSRSNAHYRKRHNNNSWKTVGLESISALDSGANGSHDAPKIVNKAKRNPPRHHILSLTTSKPGNHSNVVRTTSTKTHKIELSTQSPQRFANFSKVELPALKNRSTSSTTTTIKPSRNVQREVSKFIDKPKVTGYRGSVKFGQPKKKQ